MKFLVICDYRENYINYSSCDDGKSYNDHPTQKNITEIISAIKSLGYECEYFGGIPELIHAVDQKRTFDKCAFLNFTDGMDENYSRVQAPVLLDILNVPYSGSDVFPSVLMNNKHFCKQALKEHGISMAKSCITNLNIPIDLNELKKWKFPLFVKPNCEGSSLGITNQSVCHTIEDLECRIKELLTVFDEIIIEEYIRGIDLTNYLIGNGEIYYINDIVTAKLFDPAPYAIYGAIEKQQKMRTLYFNDEFLPANIVDKIKQQSRLIAKIIGARDICRIDYRLDLDTNDLNFIEINSAPRFSSTSEIGFIAQKKALSFEQMVQFYINTFMHRIS